MYLLFKAEFWPTRRIRFYGENAFRWVLCAQRFPLFFQNYVVEKRNRSLSNYSRGSCCSPRLINVMKQSEKGTERRRGASLCANMAYHNRWVYVSTRSRKEGGRNEYIYISFQQFRILVLLNTQKKFQLNYMTAILSFVHIFY